MARRKGSLAGHLVRKAIPLAVLALAVGGAYLYWEKKGGEPRAVEAAAPMSAIPVDVFTVKKETVPLHPRFLGQTEGSLVVEIRARVPGYLEKRTFKEGEKVTEGQQLYQIDPRPFQAELNMDTAKLTSAKANLERAQQQLARYENLSKTGAATQGELEEWQKEERVAAADVALAKAQIDSAELQLSYTKIVSPVTGIIGQALKDTGSYVDAGQNGLVAVVQKVDPIYVRFSVTETEMLLRRKELESGLMIAPKPEQQELAITLADGTTYPHKGRVNYIDVQVDQTTGTSIIRGTVSNPDGVLKPGQFVYVQPLGIERVHVMRVPQKAVMQSPAGASVFVVNAQNQAEARPVTLGDWSGEDQWIVEKGLHEGDRVIMDRLIMVRPGMPVTIAPPAPASAAETPATQPAGSPANARADAPAASETR